MNRRQLLAGSTMGAFAPMLGGCFVLNPKVREFRYRFTVEVERAGQRYSGSSVQWAKLRNWSQHLQSLQNNVYFWGGEAVVIPMGDFGTLITTREYLYFKPYHPPSPGSAQTVPYLDPIYGCWTRNEWFPVGILDRALLPQATDADDSEAASEPTGRGERERREFARTTQLADLETSPPVELTRDLLPLMLVFRDPNDPLSAQRVEPYTREESPCAQRMLDRPEVELHDYISEPELKIISATLQITQDPLTRGVVEANFPWFRRLRHGGRGGRSLYLSGKTSVYNPDPELSIAHFIHAYDLSNYDLEQE